MAFFPPEKYNVDAKYILSNGYYIKFKTLGPKKATELFTPENVLHGVGNWSFSAEIELLIEETLVNFQKDFSGTIEIVDIIGTPTPKPPPEEPKSNVPLPSHIEISGRTKTAEGESLEQIPFNIVGEGFTLYRETDENGGFNERLQGTVDVSKLTVNILPKGDLAVKAISNLVQTGERSTPTTRTEKNFTGSATEVFELDPGVEALVQRADGNFVSNVRFEKREDAIRGPNGSITPGASTGQFANGQGISTNRNIAKSMAEEDARKKLGVITLTDVVSYELVHLYELGNITLSPLLPSTDDLQDKILIESQKIENLEVKVTNYAKLPFEIKSSIVLLKTKENLKRTLLPYVLSLLAPFGAKFLQALLDKIPNPTTDVCPDPRLIKKLIRKRNKLVRELNNIYKKISRLEKVLKTTKDIILGVKIGIAIAKAAPLIYQVGAIPSILTKIEKQLEVAGIAVSTLTIAATIIGVILAQIIDLLNSLDLAIQNCSEQQDIPMEEINDELNQLVSEDSASTQGPDFTTYKGFTFEIKTDPLNKTGYTKRFAQALNIQSIPVLKSDSSFASNPQVLIDQLKFIIDSQDLKAD
tara:strand:- start:14371 stop:16128 length:1758 start_codon:yes stop_codon:yes gene_type:complete